MKLAVFSTKSYDEEYFKNLNTGHELTFFPAPLSKATAKLTEGFNGVCVFVNDVINKDVIDVLSENNIRLIVLRCAGFNNVDIKAAQEKNITVVRVPAYAPQAVAEHAIALILTLNRKTHKAYNRVKEGNFSLERLKGFNLFNKTVGVIGTGKIGAAFCYIMKGFGCNVLAYDITESEGLKEAGIVYSRLDDILATADIISLHCPLTPQTKHLFNSDTFNKIKKGLMLINTSRGALINTIDAVDALKSGKLGYLGIDVYEEEAGLFFNDLSEHMIQDDVIERLMSFHNVLITPHQAFFTTEALTEIAKISFKNIDDFENGLPSDNAVK